MAKTKPMTAAERRQAAEQKREQRDNPVVQTVPLSDEERRELANADAEAARLEALEADPGIGAEDDEEVVDRDKLPIDHQTLLAETDTVPPPEATPRPGKTSPAPSSAGPRVTKAEREAREAREPVMVEATQIGYYGLKRRRPGDVFEIADALDYSPRWMRRAAKGATPRETTSQAALRETQAAARAFRMSNQPGQPPAEPNPLEE